MNKIFKIVWSQATRTWTVTSELSKAKGKSCSSKTVVGAVLMGLSLSAGAVTLDEMGEVVEQHTAAIGENTAAIAQNTGKINQNTADIGANTAAIEQNAAAIEQNAVEIGNNKDATEANTAAIGQNTAAIGESKTAIEQNKVAIGENKAAITAADQKINALSQSSADGLAQLDTKVTEAKKEAADNLKEATKHFKATSGKADANAAGTDSVAVGPAAQALAQSAVAVGDEATAAGENAVAMGTKSNAAANAVAMGTMSNAAADAVAIGTQTKAAANAIAMGNTANAAGNSIAMGNKAQAIESNSVAMGHGAQANTKNSIAIGLDAGQGTSTSIESADYSNVAIGTKAGQNVNGSFNTAVGHLTGRKVEGQYNVVLGNEAGNNLKGDGNISIGHQANKNIDQDNNDVPQNVEWAIAIGKDTKSTGNDSIAMGSGARAQGVSGIALGQSSFAKGDTGVAIGQGARANDAGVALGAGSMTDSMLKAPGSYLSGEAAPGSAVSIGLSEGSTAFTRRITNVSGGAADHDAVNVKQLKQAQQAVANLVGDGTGVRADGSFAYMFDGKSYSTINDAIRAIQSGTVPGSPMDNAVLYDATGSVITLKGLHGTKITGVADGQADGDAVNLGQLKKVVDEGKTHYFSIKTEEGLAGSNFANEGAKGKNSMAIGPSARAESELGTAIGYGALAGLEKNEGQNTNTAVSLSATAVGNHARAEQSSSTAMGHNSRAYGESSVAVGHNTKANAERSIAMGKNAEVMQAEDNGKAAGDGIAIGVDSLVTRNEGIAFGTRAKSQDYSAMALGVGAHAKEKALQSTAIGYKAITEAEGALATGREALASGFDSTAIGTKSKAVAKDSNAFGTGAESNGVNGTAIGTGAIDYAVSGIAIGTGAIAGNKNNSGAAEEAVAIGNKAVAEGKQANAWGSSAKVTAERGVAMGTKAEVRVGATDGLAMGTGAIVHDNATKAIAMGAGSQVNAKNGAALGSGAQVNRADSIALGSNSKTDDVLYNSEAAYSKVKHDDAKTGIVSVGAKGAERRITNVAGGQSDTDGVNVAQLKALDKVLTERGMNFAGNTGAVEHRNLGETLAITGGIKDAATETSGENLITRMTDNGLSIEMAKNAKFTSVTTGNTVMNNEGLTINGGPSITTGGINAGDQVIKNVAPGKKGTDAVNVDQLTEVNKVANKGWQVKSDNVLGSTQVKPGDTVDIGLAADEKNLSVAAKTDKATGETTIDFALNKELKLTSVTTGNTVMNNNGLTINDGPSITTGGINAGDQVIKNVAPGQKGTDAVNVDQLTKVSDVANKGWNVTTQGANSSNVKPGDTVDFKNTDGNIKITNKGNELTFDLAKNLTGLDKVETKELIIKDGKPGADGKPSQDLNVGAELNKGLNFVTNEGKFNRQLGETTTIKGLASTAGTFSGNNLKTVADAEGNINLLMADAPKFGDITINQDGKITGVQDGVAGKDAVNVDQLTKVSEVANKGWNVTTQGANSSNVKPGDTVDFKNTDGNIKIANKGNELTFDLAKNLTGLDKVETKELIIKDGKPGADGKPSQDLNVGAELNKGLNFVTNEGKFNRQLGETTTVKGLASTAGTFSGNNLKTVADAEGNINLLMADAPKFGDITINQDGKITGVQDGVAGKDAVNVDQLTKVSEVANKGWNVTTQGANSSNVKPGDTVDFKNTDGNIKIANKGNELTFDLAKNLTGLDKVETKELIIKDGKPGADGKPSQDLNVGAELNKGLNFVTNEGKFNRQLGETTTVKGLASTAGTFSGNNLKTVADAEGNINLLMADAPKFGDITINKDGKITGVQDGVAGKDAVNVDQLTKVSEVANKGWNVTTQGANSSNVKPGDTVDFKNTDGNIKISNAGNNLTFDLAKNLTGLDKVETKELIIKDGKPGADGKPSKDLNVGEELNKGLDFAGNTGEFNRQLGEKTTIKGEATTAGTYVGKNLKTVADEKGNINLQMAERPEFSGLVLNGADGKDASIAFNGKDGKPGMSLVGKDGGLGLQGADGKAGIGFSDDGRITNVTAGKDGKDAVNVDQLGELGTDLTNKGLNFAGNDGEFHRNLGEKTTIKGEATTEGAYVGKNLKTVADDKGNINLQMAERPEFSGLVLNGADGKDASIAFNGKDGKPGMSLVGKDGGLGLQGADGKAGIGFSEDGRITNVTAGKDGKDAVNMDQLGEFNTDLTTKGLDFAGNDGEFHRNLGEKTTIKGEATTEGAYVGKNLKTVADEKGNINLQMAERPEFSGLVLNGADGKDASIAFNGKDGKPGMSLVGKDGGLGLQGADGKAGIGFSEDGRITNVAPGIDGKDAVNMDQLGELGTDLTNKGLNFAGNDGEFHRNLGEKTTIKGEATTEGTYVGKNLKTVADAEGNINLQMAERPEFSGLVLNGADGKDASIAFNGKDGKPGMSLVGKDGGLGLQGADGKAGIGFSEDGRITNVAPGKDGKDAVNMDQLGEFNTDLTAKGMDFAGNDGEFHRNLGEKTTIKGEATTEGAYVGKNLKTVADEKGNINLQMAERPEFSGLVLNGADGKDASITFNGKDGKPGMSLVGKDGGLGLQGADGKAGVGFSEDGRITNVAAGKDGTDAVNVDQLGELGTDLTNKGMDFAGNDGEFHRNLGEKTTIKGEATTEGTYVGKNLKTVADAEGNINLQMAERPEFSGLVLNGADGKDASIAFNGKDGKPGMSLVGKDGGLGLQGADGKAGIGFSEDGRITNVAPGKDGKDAVNVDQLGEVTQVANKGWNIKSDNALTSKQIKPGETVDIGLADTESNLKVAAKYENGIATIDFSLNKNLTVNSFTSSTGKPIDVHGGFNILNGGLTIAKGPAGTVNMGGNQITGVGAGTLNDHAVNLGQLNQAINDLQWRLEGEGDGNGGAVVNPGNPGNGNGSKPGEKENGGNTGGSGTDSSDTGNPKDNPNTGVGNSNTVVMKGENNIKVTVDKGSNTVTIGTNGNGDVSSGSKDVITGGQLNNLAEEVQKTFGSGVTYVSKDGKVSLETKFEVAGGKQDNVTDALNDLDNSAVHYDKTADGKVDKSKVTLGEKGKEVTVGNVAAGVKDNDAVNVSQLKGAVTKIDNQFNEVHQNMGKMNQRIDDIDKDSRAGVAAAMAAAGLPQAYLPGKSMMAIAGSTWRGESGYAIGVSTISDNGNWVVKANMSGNARSQYGASAGVGYQW
ncbi:YadA-like family protein [Neisseriaceae bacterium CLB008]